MARVEPFPLRVREAPFEPPWGLLNRLAVRHRASSASDLLGMSDVSRRFLADRIAAGRELDVLSALSGVPEADLVRSTFIRSPFGLVVDGVLVARSVAGRTRRRGPFCPLCVREDMQRDAGPDACRPHRRWWWDLAVGLACVEHRVLLADACPDCGTAATRDWLVPGTCPCGADAGRVATRRWSAEEMAFESYLHRRLLGGPPGGGTFLDALAPTDAALAVAHVGRVWLHGRAPPAIAKLSRAELIEARAAGFEALSDWPAGLHRVLDAVQPPRTSAKIGPSHMYKMLNYWLLGADADVFEPLRREIGIHYLGRWPATGGLSILGTPVVDSRWVTLGVLAEWAGCSLERARGVALEAGCVDPGKLSRATPIVREDARRLARLIRTSLGTVAARELLGVRADVFKSLVKSGLVRRLAYGGAGGSIFSHAELHGFLRGLSDGVPGVDVVPAGALGIPETAAATNRSVVAIAVAIRAKLLRPVGRLAGGPGLDGLLVSLRDVAALNDHRRRRA